MMISKPELEVHESFKVLHVRTEVNISKALRMQLKELGRSSSQPPEGDFCSPRLPQREFLAPRIQAPEFRDPSYPKGILTPIMGLLRLPPTHTSTPERVWRFPNPGSDKGTQFQGLSPSPQRPWERPPRSGPSGGGAVAYHRLFAGGSFGYLLVEDFLGLV